MAKLNSDSTLRGVSDGSFAWVSQTSDTLLFELATEEIPAAYQKNLYADWEKRLPQLLKATALPYKEVKIFASARRQERAQRRSRVSMQWAPTPFW